MRPTSLDNYIGLELEMLCDDVDKVKNYVHKNNLGNNFQVGHDSSIVPVVDNFNVLEEVRKLREKRTELLDDFHYHRADEVEKQIQKLQRQLKYKSTLELRILIPEHQRQEYFKELKKLLSSQNFYVNSSCGFHVHLDMRYRNKVKALGLLFSNLEDIKKDVHPDRLKNKYCMINKTKSVSSQLKNNNKYRAINTASLREHGAIEVRLHEGTVDIKKIESWVDKLINIVTPANLRKTG